MAQSRLSRKIIKLEHIPPTFWLNWRFKLEWTGYMMTVTFYSHCDVYPPRTTLIPFLTYTFVLLNFLWHWVPQLSFTLPARVFKLVLPGKQSWLFSGHLLLSMSSMYKESQTWTNCIIEQRDFSSFPSPLIPQILVSTLSSCEHSRKFLS